MTDITIAAEAADSTFVSLANGEATTTSLTVAECFDKSHFHVIRDIRTLAAAVPADHPSKFGCAFRQVPGPNGATRSEQYYTLNFHAFALLAMGYKGPKALKFKLAFSAEFARLQRSEHSMKLLLAEQGRLAAEAQVKRLATEVQDLFSDNMEAQENYAKLERDLIKTLKGENRALRQVNNLVHRFSRREAKHQAVGMVRRGDPRELIITATGINANYLRQIVFRARKAGDLPALSQAEAAAEAAQGRLDLGAHHG